MKGRLNNIIRRYETERDKLKVDPNPGPSARARLAVIDEILRTLNELKG